jgi:hypothetical protein
LATVAGCVSVPLQVVPERVSPLGQLYDRVAGVEVLVELMQFVPDKVEPAGQLYTGVAVAVTVSEHVDPDRV